MLRRFSRALKALSACAFYSCLSGCMGTGGITPTAALPAPDALATDKAIQAAAAQAQWPSETWWQAFKDPQLDHWVGLAVAGSPSLAIAAARLRQARSAAGLAQARETPQLSAEGTLHRRNWPTDGFYGPGDLANQTTWDNNAGLSLSYDLDLWHRDQSASERALDLAHVAAAEMRQAQLVLTQDVVRVYIALALSYAQQDILKATLAQQSQVLDLANKRLTAGIGTQLEVSQAQTLLPETHRQLDDMEEQIAQARNQLAALAGKGPGEGATIKRPQLQLATAPGLPSHLPAQLLGQRPDVVASRWQVAAQARGIEVAHAGFYPNVDLTASLSYMATSGGMLEFLTGHKLGYSAGPAFSLPLFDGGRLRSELGEAAAGYDLAVARYREVLANALKEVSDQLIRGQSLAHQAAFAQESVASAQQAYDLAKVGWQRGLTGYLDVLQAQTALLRQRTIEEHVQASRLAAQAGLMTALGGGLGAGADVPATERLAAPPTPPALSLMNTLEGVGQP
ncbi:MULTISPECIES: efflux transporter outer membrane subunit [Pseudomonas]|uniref:Efflux transporter outer membrane subunit n=1 Tax=Pseudomonas quercus TaxID=2722792 RepID=A0ABX0YBZ4_9PSED|nr:efflux transporter outer membrane subunit [Pseudomonas sp. LY10J]MBF7141869.1 efflux transporter outer membrane subunit [Pseudomonas sp. LY10J]NJP00407.1 efflux transporter outer membrane subunit [Pseudomonas quercus]